MESGERAVPFRLPLYFADDDSPDSPDFTVKPHCQRSESFATKLIKI